MLTFFQVQKSTSEALFQKPLKIIRLWQTNFLRTSIRRSYSNILNKGQKCFNDNFITIQLQTWLEDFIRKRLIAFSLKWFPKNSNRSTTKLVWKFSRLLELGLKILAFLKMVGTSQHQAWIQSLWTRELMPGGNNELTGCSHFSNETSFKMLVCIYWLVTFPSSSINKHVKIFG